jgi:hypothetical protein
MLCIPTELILYIVENYYYKPYALCCVNKEMNNTLKKHMEKEHKIYLYIKECQNVGKSWIANLFTRVRTIDDCNYVSLIINRLFDNNELKKRIKYTVENSTQIPTEIWYKYITCYN